MPKPKFELPAITSKTVTPNTLKVYKNRLNKLVPYGFTTIQDIMQRPDEVIAAVNKLIESHEGDPTHQRHGQCRCPQCVSREHKRYFYTAIFYALADSGYIKIKNPLYDEFQVLKQNYNSH